MFEKEIIDLERRKYRRLNLSEEPLVLHVTTEEYSEEKIAEVLNLSENGIFIRTVNVLPVRKRVRFVLFIDKKENIVGIGRVLDGYNSFNKYYYRINILSLALENYKDKLIQFINTRIEQKGYIDRREAERRCINKKVRKDVRKSSNRLKKSIFRKCVTNTRFEEFYKLNIYMRTVTDYKGSKVKIDGKELISYTDCSYFGLNDHPKIKDAMISAINKYGTNCSSSRMLGGTSSLHIELEERLARFTGNEACIVYSLGYMANLGCISAIVKPEDFLLLDMKSHASLIDASMLSQGKLIPFKHNNLENLEKALLKVKGKVLIVTDGVFSTHGDICPLDELYKLANKYDAGLMVDDAHGLFVLGKHGRGTAELFNLDGKIDITMGTLSKAIPLLGGFISGKETIIKYLKASSRTFIFTLALPPPIVSGIIAALDIIEQEPDLRMELFNRVNYFNKKLGSIGFKQNNSVTPIIPVLIGDDDLACKIIKLLESKGIFIDAVTYPAVKMNDALLRFIITLRHSYEELDYTITELEKIYRKFEI